MDGQIAELIFQLKIPFTHLFTFKLVNDKVSKSKKILNVVAILLNSFWMNVDLIKTSSCYSIMLNIVV